MRAIFAEEAEGVSRTVDLGWRRLFVALGDLLAWPICFYSITILLQRPLAHISIVLVALTAMALQLVIGYAIGLYRDRFQPLSFEEAGAIAVTTVSSGLVVAALVVMRVYGKGYPFGHVVVLATWAGLSLMLGHRYLRRLRARMVASAHARQLQPILVLGAGAGGYRSINAMLSLKSSPYRPVALLDDDPMKRHVRIAGLRVVGTSRDMSRP